MINKKKSTKLRNPKKKTIEQKLNEIGEMEIEKLIKFVILQANGGKKQKR